MVAIATYSFDHPGDTICQPNYLTLHFFLQITTAAIANSIGVEPGLFEVSDLPDSDKQPDMISSASQDAAAEAASAESLINDASSGKLDTESSPAQQTVSVLK